LKNQAKTQDPSWSVTHLWV